MSTKQSTGQEVWTSDLETVDADEVQVHVPQYLRYICEHLKTEVGKNEFSILCKGEWRKTGFHLGTEYLVPEQTVNTGHVDYDEDLIPYKDDGFNVVIHRHPGKMNSFSSTDDEFINDNFPVSVLFSDSGFPTGIVNVEPMTGLKLQFEANPVSKVTGEVEISEDVVAALIEHGDLSMNGLTLTLESDVSDVYDVPEVSEEELENITEERITVKRGTGKGKQQRFPAYFYGAGYGASRSSSDDGRTGKSREKGNGDGKGTVTVVRKDGRDGERTEEFSPEDLGEVDKDLNIVTIDGEKHCTECLNPVGKCFCRKSVLRPCAKCGEYPDACACAKTRGKGAR